MKPNSYSLGEGINLVVRENGDFVINAATPACPSSAQVRAEVRTRYGYAVTLGGWRLENTTWICTVTSKLKATPAKPRSAS